MTQKNINTMDAIVNELVAGKKIAKALKTVYNKRNVAIPCNDELLATDITELHMSMRTTNSLLRGGIKTIADVASYCAKDKITTLKTFGMTSGTELFETILNYMWDNMSKKERESFLIDVVERNEKNLK